MEKEILFGSDGRERLLRGANTVYNAVKETLGARGKNVVIYEKGRNPYITKDGINTIRRIILDDPVENMGAQLIKQASEKTAEETGDATTSTAILAYNILEKGMQALEEDINVVQFVKGMDKALALITDEIKASSKMPDETDIVNIAKVSTNNDEFMGSLIGELMNKMGVNGRVLVADSLNGDTYYEEASGMKINKGWASPYMITAPDKGTMDYSEPIIMVTDEEIFRMDQVLPFAEYCHKKGKAAIIICSNTGGEALGFMNHNITKKGLKAGIIIAPDHGGLSRDILEDIAIYCGAELVTEKTGKTTTNLDDSWFGTASRLISNSNQTTIIMGNGDISQRVAELNTYIKEGKDIKKVNDSKERLSNLTGKTAILYVYEDTPSALIERKDRIDDAIHATQAAMEEGIVPGGGLCLYNIYEKHCDFMGDNDAETMGGRAVIQSLNQPILILLQNANLSLAKLSYDMTDKIGFDVLSERHIDMIEAGIVDPTKSIRVSVKNAHSVAKTLLTTNVVII
jgi:chaperonin GroEL